MARECVAGIREVGNATGLRPFFAREFMPGDLKGDDLDQYLRDAAMSFWHQAGTAKMGRDPRAVVDGSLRVYGIDRLRVADASIMPTITAGNTMAPCVVIGELAADEITTQYRLRKETIAQ